MKLHKFIINSILATSLALSATVMAETTSMSPTTSSPLTNATQTQSSTGQFSPEQVKQIEQIIEKYLVSNPQVLVKASQALQRQILQRQQAASIKAVNTNAQAIFANPQSPVAGNLQGNIVLVEFFDYQCGHCKAMGPIVQALLSANPNLKIVFKELPIFGANSNFAAAAALASVKQGKYHQFHNALLAHSDPLTQNNILKIAQSVGINVDLLKKDMSENKQQIKQQLKENFQLAQKLQIMGTPAFIIAQRSNTNNFSNFRFIPGAVPKATLQAEINSVK